MSKKGKKKIKLDEFHYHEALDRCHLLVNQIDEYLLSHPVITKDKKLRKKINTAISLLADCYQEIGGLQVALFPEKKKKSKKVL